MTFNDPAVSVRKKAALTLSSAVRNCPAALEKVLPGLPDSIKPQQSITADDMDALNEIFGKIRQQIS
jgi:hypothetical protein